MSDSKMHADRLAKDGEDMCDQYHEELLSRDFRRGIDGIEGPGSCFDQLWISTGVEAIEKGFDYARVGEGEDVTFVSCRAKSGPREASIMSTRNSMQCNAIKEKKTRGQRGQKGEVSREG